MTEDIFSAREIVLNRNRNQTPERQTLAEYVHGTNKIIFHAFTIFARPQKSSLFGLDSPDQVTNSPFAYTVYKEECGGTRTLQ